MPNDQMPPQPDPQLPVSITLPYGAWQMVIQLVMQGPWNTVDPLIRFMRHQIALAAQQSTPPANSSTSEVETAQ